MKKIRIISIQKVVELEEFEYEIDPLGHGGVKILVENLKNKKLCLELKGIMKKFNYPMIVGVMI